MGPVISYIIFIIASKTGLYISPIYCSTIRVTIIYTKLSSSRYTIPNIQVCKNITNNFHIIIDIIFTHSHFTYRIIKIIKSCRSCPVTIYIINRNHRWHNHSQKRFPIDFYTANKK